MPTPKDTTTDAIGPTDRSVDTERDWRVECTISGKGHDVRDTLVEACREAVSQCTTDWSKWSVWEAGNRVADCTLRGVTWIRTDYRHLAYRTVAGDTPNTPREQ